MGMKDIKVTATLKVIVTGEFYDFEASEETLRSCVEQDLEDVGFDVDVELLKEQPDIVRCADCRHYGYKDMINVDGFCYCLKRHEYPSPDWYCADGVRDDME